MPVPALVVVLFAFAANRLSAQLLWTQRTPPVSPPAGALLAYDSVRGRCVAVSNTFTWEWDGLAWSQRSTVMPTPRRDSFAMAFDEGRGELVLFGGENSSGGTELRDTWIWNGATWSLRATAAAPLARGLPAMAYDRVRGRVVLFGGRNAGHPLNDTWEFDGTNWAQRASTQPYPPLSGAQLVFDAARDQLLLYGEQAYNSTLFDTWEGVVVGNATFWVQRTTLPASPALPASAMLYDAARRRTVLFGFDSQGLPQLWEWDGNAWSRQQPPQHPPSTFFYPALAYDATRQVGVLLVERYSSGTTRVRETWELASARPAQQTAYGTGCAGSSGVPVLGPQPYSLPWLADTFGLQLGNLPASAPGVLVVGASRTSWAGLPLPFDLTPAGMPGCALWAAGQLWQPFVAQNGTARLNLALPNDPALVGGQLYSQGLAADALANAAGLTVSNGNEARIGAR